MKKNISKAERVISALGGCYLLYDSLKRKKSIPEVAAAGLMVFRGVSGYCPATGAIDYFSEKRHKSHNSNINVHSRLLVNKPINEVYDFWRNLSNLPLFMDHLDEVREISEVHSEWKAKLPGGFKTLSWKAQIVGEEPYRYIGWSSMPSSSVRHSGKVEFKDAGELGTLIHIVFSYTAPLGDAGEEIAKLLSPVFENMVRKDVLGFKRYMETGRPEKISQETHKIYS